MAVMVFAVSCDGDDPDPLNVTGTWIIVSSASADLTAVLTHTVTTITGTVTDAANDASSIGGNSNMPAGSTSGSRSVELSVTFNDLTQVRFIGDVNDNNTIITGTYTKNSQNNSGSFTAQRQ
jgi:hypothetical protein